jgi:hypothetical protein
MKWLKPELAPEFKVVLVQAKLGYRNENTGRQMWSAGWIVCTAARWGDLWETYPSGRGAYADVPLKVRAWTECPEGPRLPKPDKMKMAISRLEREARDEEFRRQGWNPRRNPPPKVMMTVRVLRANKADYGPYYEYTTLLPDGRLPDDARAWRSI